MPPINPPATATATSVDAMRPSRKYSRRRTTGASRNEARMASASGMSTSRARYRTAAATSSPASDEVLLAKSKEQQRPCGHLVVVTERKLRLFLRIGEVRVGEQLPALAAVGLGKPELHQVLPRIENDEERRLLAALVNAGGLRTAVEQHAEAAHVGILPVLLAHLLAGGIDPGHVLHAEFRVERARGKARAPQDRV